VRKRPSSDCSRRSDLVEFHDGEKSLGDDLLAASAVLLLLPGLVAVLGSRWAMSKSLRPLMLRLVGGSEAHNATSAWNALFAELGPCLVRATLADGRTIGGRYDESCVAGYSEQIPDLYLSQRWDLDDEWWFVAPSHQSLGLWLSNASIVSLEFYDIPDTIQMERETSKIKG